MLHETEAGTASDHITPNFKRQYGSSFQIAVQKDVLDCISLYYTQFQMLRRGSFHVFLHERESGTACDKGLF